MDEFELLAACDPDPEQLKDAQAQHGCADYQDMAYFVDHPGLELVVNAAPNHPHGPLTIAALESGKHSISVLVP
jgi:predicted dehydrogenase